MIARSTDTARKRRRTPQDPLPPEGRPLRYLHDGREYIGDSWGTFERPKVARDEHGKPLWILPPGALVWVWTGAGFALVCRIDGKWTSVDIPDAMPLDPRTRIATEHRPPIEMPQESLW